MNEDDLSSCINYALNTHLNLISELTSRVPQGVYGEYIYTEKALYGSKKECARTDTVFLPISEVCDGIVSLDFAKFMDLAFYISGNWYQQS